MVTANDPGTAVKLPGIDAQLDAFTQNIKTQLCR